MKLIEEMKKHLPIPAYPSKELCKLLRGRGKNIKPNEALEITTIFDSGDAGGIVCSIMEEDGEVYVVSLTHLRIKSDHPLRAKISTYQKRRVRKLSRQMI